MGTVHAKADHGEVGGGLFEFEEPVDLDDERTLPKPSIQLGGVRARVDRVHVDGLSRTKDDVVRGTVNDLFLATDFEDVILRAHKVRRALDSMGCFRDIGVLIDVSSGPDATPEGLEVTFQVKELSRIVGGINTTVSENEGNLVIGVKMPNVLGRGERLHAEYSVGHRSTSNFSIAATKPFPRTPLVPVLTTSIFQQNHEYPWSGYRLLDRGVLLDVAFKTSPRTTHNLQWEGLVRDTSVLSKTTSFKVRESSGPQMKSALRHIVTVDNRDEPIFPQRGTRVQFSSEVSGLGGGVAFLKSELLGEANVPLAENIVFQVSGALGVLHDMFGTELTEHFYLGGATTLRGFRQRGAGPHSDNQATGGRMYWASGVHVYTPLPFRPGAGGLGDLFRSHLFANAGWVQAMYWASGVHLYTPLPFRPGAGGLGDLFRSHLFANAGCLAGPEESSAMYLSSLSQVRVSIGAGIALRLGRVAKAELNYCVPIRACAGDATAPGLQLGVGAHFL